MLQQLVDALVLASIYTLFSIGMSLAWGALGILNFAHGTIFVTAAFAAHLVAAQVAISLPVALLVGALTGGLVSLLLQVLIFAPIRRRARDDGQMEMQVLIASIGVGTILTAIVAEATGSQAFSIATGFTQSMLEFGGLRATDLQVVIVVVGAVVGIALGLWITRTRGGRALRAVAANSEVASLMAIDSRRVAGATMFTAGVLVGLAGVLLASYQGATDVYAGSRLLTTAFAIIIIGGVGSLTGTLAGALILAVLETVLAYNTSGVWTPAISFALIIFVLLLRPQGLFASSRTAVDRV
ncbi:branched-chain amino acid ABC transporter permease [Pseudonocardia ailaonensis]|uniref:Branched-chain amino acid ABC transporter permease n=1 Tax=Pseudonocardia ailaonensis TaxID=367279 RepID=A0ABN2NIW2_9PSEU